MKKPMEPGGPGRGAAAATGERREGRARGCSGRRAARRRDEGGNSRTARAPPQRRATHPSPRGCGAEEADAEAERGWGTTPPLPQPLAPCEETSPKQPPRRERATSVYLPPHNATSDSAARACPSAPCGAGLVYQLGGARPGAAPPPPRAPIGSAATTSPAQRLGGSARRPPATPSGACWARAPRVSANRGKGRGQPQPMGRRCWLNPRSAAGLPGCWQEAAGLPPGWAGAVTACNCELLAPAAHPHSLVPQTLCTAGSCRPCAAAACAGLAL